MELALCGSQRVVRALCLDEKLDLGSHRAEGATLDHDVLVIVRGGRVTMRTPVYAAAGCALWAAISALRACSAAR